MDAGTTRSTSPAEQQGVPRRSAIVSAGALGGAALAAVALTACDDGGGGGGGGGEAPEQGTVLGKASDVQVGGGAIFKDAETVVTQQAKGEFAGFSAICTHQGCVVDNVSDGAINCKCHGSKFKLDGTVANGPATKPLAARKVTVNGSGELVTG